MGFNYFPYFPYFPERRINKESMVNFLNIYIVSLSHLFIML